ncbi:helix-turn-helix transcriptional regulator [Massilia aurea]|nr:helix-turn-helix domain-containing protein [Massilia aurea]
MQRMPFVLRDDYPLRALGTAIRALRNEQGISQEDLADLCGIDRSHLGRIERGERNVGILNIVKIAEALTCTLAELFRRAEL